MNYMPGKTVDEVVSALVKDPLTHATKPIDIELSGAHGKQIDLAYSGSQPQTLVALSTDAKWGLTSGSLDRILVLDVNGSTVTIDVEAPTNKFASFLALAEEILQSVMFNP
jgi:hypothetical protein